MMVAIRNLLMLNLARQNAAVGSTIASYRCRFLIFTLYHAHSTHARTYLRQRVPGNLELRHFPFRRILKTLRVAEINAALNFIIRAGQ